MSVRVLATLLILVLHAAPENPTEPYMIRVVEFCAEMYAVDGELCHCIVSEESEWNPNARGDDGEAVGLWQWHEESIETALRDMGIAWDWAKGDPRLSVWASSLAAAHAISQGWRWWVTQESCEGLGR